MVYYTFQSARYGRHPKCIPGGGAREFLSIACSKEWANNGVEKLASCKSTVAAEARRAPSVASSSLALMRGGGVLEAL